MKSFYQKQYPSKNIKSHKVSSKFLSDPVQRTISKYKHHPSALSIQGKIFNEYKFFFTAVNKIDVKKEIKNINPWKASTKNGYVSKNIKSHKVSSKFLEKLVNDAIISDIFPGNLKLADVTPVFKKEKHSG